MTTMSHTDLDRGAAPAGAPAPLRIALVDDAELVASGLEALLAPYADRVELVGQRDAIARPGDLDVVLFDPAGLSGYSASVLEQLRRAGSAHMVPYTWSPEAAMVRGIDKHASAGRLVSTLEDVVAGRHLERLLEPARPAARLVEAPATPAATAAVHSVDEHPDLAELTGRERDVLRLIASGRPNAQIATELCLSINSVKTYIRSAYRKAGITSRTQAVLWATDRGLVQPRLALAEQHVG